MAGQRAEDLLALEVGVAGARSSPAAQRSWCFPAVTGHPGHGRRHAPPPRRAHRSSSQSSGTRITARAVIVVGMMSSTRAAGSSAGQNSICPPRAVLAGVPLPLPPEIVSGRGRPRPTRPAAACPPRRRRGQCQCGRPGTVSTSAQNRSVRRTHGQEGHREAVQRRGRRARHREALGPPARPRRASIDRHGSGSAAFVPDAAPDPRERPRRHVAHLADGRVVRLQRPGGDERLDGRFHRVGRMEFGQAGQPGPQIAVRQVRVRQRLHPHLDTGGRRAGQPDPLAQHLDPRRVRGQRRAAPRTGHAIRRRYRRPRSWRSRSCPGRRSR